MQKIYKYLALFFSYKIAPKSQTSKKATYHLERWMSLNNL